jgi:hypothetical protein
MSMSAAPKLTIATRMQFVRTHLAVSSARANRDSLVLEQQAVKMSMNAALGHTIAMRTRFVRIQSAASLALANVDTKGREQVVPTSMSAAEILTTVMKLPPAPTHLAVSSARANQDSLVPEQQAVKMSMNAALGHTTAT